MDDNSRFDFAGDYTVPVGPRSTWQAPPPEPRPEPDPECIGSGSECEGEVRYRDPLSATGVSYPRCDHHWSERLELEEGLRRRYPEHPPEGWSPYDAGESWYEDE